MKSKYFSCSSHLYRISKNWLASFYTHTLYSALFSIMPSGPNFFFLLTSASFIMQGKFPLMLRLDQEEWAGQHVFPHLDSQINSYSSSSPTAEESKFSYRGSMPQKKNQMQYLGIVVQSTVNNFLIQQLSAPLIFTQSKLFHLQFGVFF